MILLASQRAVSMIGLIRESNEVVFFVEVAGLRWSRCDRSFDLKTNAARLNTLSKTCPWDCYLNETVQRTVPLVLANQFAKNLKLIN